MEMSMEFSEYRRSFNSRASQQVREDPIERNSFFIKKFQNGSKTPIGELPFPLNEPL